MFVVIRRQLPRGPGNGAKTTVMRGPGLTRCGLGADTHISGFIINMPCRDDGRMCVLLSGIGFGSHGDVRSDGPGLTGWRGGDGSIAAFNLH